MKSLDISMYILDTIYNDVKVNSETINFIQEYLLIINEMKRIWIQVLERA
jgi:hypothetical protein